MINALVALTTNPNVLLAIMVSVAIFATIVSVSLPLLSGDKLEARMKAVALERDKIRARERANLLAEGQRGSLRSKESKAYMRSLVERPSLRNALLDKKGEEMLRMAGFRSEAATTTFLFARFVLPFVFIAVAFVEQREVEHAAGRRRVGERCEIAVAAGRQKMAP